MGGIKKFKKKVLSPGHPYDKVRIERELPLVGEYGLRNKRELWKARTVLSKARQQARGLLALTAEIREQREKELLSRLISLGMLPQGSDLDSVLALDVRTVLNRRLQTIVHRSGLAASPYQARQFITHRHIAIDRSVVTSPGRLIKISEEDNITYAPQSPLYGKDHPSRPQAPPVKEIVEPPEKKEAPKPISKPTPKPKIKKEIKEELIVEEGLQLDKGLKPVDDIEPEVKAKPKPKPEVKAKPKPKPEVKAKPKPKPEVKAKPEVKPIPKPKVDPKAEKPKDEKPKVYPKVDKAIPTPKPKEDKPKVAEKKTPAVKVDISQIKGVGAKTAMLLKDGGFDTVEKIANASAEDLAKVPGIGPSTASAMNKEAINLLKQAKEEAK